MMFKAYLRYLRGAMVDQPPYRIDVFDIFFGNLKYYFRNVVGIETLSIHIQIQHYDRRRSAFVAILKDVIDKDGSRQQTHGFEPVTGMMCLAEHKVQTTGINYSAMAELLVERQEVFLV